MEPVLVPVLCGLLAADLVLRIWRRSADRFAAMPEEIERLAGSCSSLDRRVTALEAATIQAAQIPMRLASLEATLESVVQSSNETREDVKKFGESVNILIGAVQGWKR